MTTTASSPVSGRVKRTVIASPFSAVPTWWNSISYTNDLLALLQPGLAHQLVDAGHHRQGGPGEGLALSSGVLAVELGLAGLDALELALVQDQHAHAGRHGVAVTGVVEAPGADALGAPGLVFLERRVVLVQIDRG